MTKTYRFLTMGLMCLGLLAWGETLRAQDKPTGTADWHQLLQASSIERVIREMPNYLKQGLDQAKAQGAPIPPEVEKALKAAADEVFDFQGLQGAAMAHLQSSLSAEQLADWLAFYRSPLGQKLTAADERAASPAFQSLLMERAPQVMETLSKDPSRMALLQSWLQATDSVEQATTLAMQTGLALEWGLISTMPQAMGQPTFEELKQHMDEQRFALRAQMAQMTLVHAAAAYQAFSLEELGLMLKMANSAAGKALYRDFSRQLSATLAMLSEQLGQVAGRQLAQQPA